MKNIEIFFPYSKSDNLYTYKYIFNEHVDYILKHEGYLFMSMNSKYLAGNLTHSRLHAILYLHTEYTHNKSDRGYCYAFSKTGNILRFSPVSGYSTSFCFC